MKIDILNNHVFQTLHFTKLNIFSSKNFGLFKKSQLITIKYLKTKLYFSLKGNLEKIFQNSSKFYYLHVKLNGLGFRIWKKQNKLIFDLGYGHYTSVFLSQNIFKSIIKKDRAFIFATEKEVLNQFRTILNNIKPLNQYTWPRFKNFWKNYKKKNRKKDRTR